MSKYQNMTAKELTEFFVKSNKCIDFTFDEVNEDGSVDSVDGEPCGWYGIAPVNVFDGGDVAIGDYGYGILATWKDADADDETLEEFIFKFFKEEGSKTTVCVEVEG